MAYGPPNSLPTAPRDRARGGGLPAIGALLILQLLLELGVLGFDLSRYGLSYLPTALGLSYAHIGRYAPVGFYGYDTALSAALAAVAIGAFVGGRWARPAAVVLVGTNAYNAAASLLNQLFNGRRFFAGSSLYLLLNLTQVLSVLLGLVVIIVVAATRPTAPRPATAGPAPFTPPAPAYLPPYPPAPPAPPTA